MSKKRKSPNQHFDVDIPSVLVLRQAHTHTTTHTKTHTLTHCSAAGSPAGELEDEFSLVRAVGLI
jgi:hypothetical protein